MGSHSQIVPFSVDWHQIAFDGGLAVLVADSEGRIVCINSGAARLIAKRAAKDLAGSKLADLFPGPAANERLEISRGVIHGGEAVVVSDLWAGVALRATVRRVEFAGGQGSGAMWVYAPEAAAGDELLEKTTLRVIEARHTDLGALSGLTNSELKVLALIGEGLSNAEIAGRLHRAVKTIESHRAALTEKTGTASRVQLGIMARRAGLMRRVSLNDTRRSGVSV